MLIKSGLILSRNLYTAMTASSRAKLALTNAAPKCADADVDVVVHLQPMFKFMMLMMPSCGSEILYLLANVATSYVQTDDHQSGYVHGQTRTRASIMGHDPWWR